MISATCTNLQQVSRIIVYTRVIDAITRFSRTQGIRATCSKVERNHLRRNDASTESKLPCSFAKTISPAIDVTEMANKTDKKEESSVIKRSSPILSDEMSVRDDRDEYGIDQELTKPLNYCTEDISHIHSVTTASYNIAKYANESYVIQELIKLGVKVNKLDFNAALAEFYLTRDFDKDVKPYIQFLHDMGIPADRLGQVLSKNLSLIKFDLDDLQQRVNYMKSHKFTDEMIALMTMRSPQWLCQRIEITDANLGYIQKTLKMTGAEIRIIALKNSAVLLTSPYELSKIIFAVTRELKFSNDDTKRILLNEPSLFTCDRHKLVETYDYLRNEMKLPCETIAQEPKLLTYRKDRIHVRYEFLKALNRAQFDPKKPLYVCPLTFIRLSDHEFCNTVCKCNAEIYFQFMKML